MARSVRVIKESELRENGGDWIVSSGPAIPVSIAEEWQYDENDIQGGASTPIYIVSPTDEEYPRLARPVTEVVRLTTSPRPVGRHVARPVYLVPESPAYGTIDSIDWDYRDDFLDTHAAGTLEDTLASDGINPRTSILDPLDGFATNGSELVISQGGIAEYPTYIDAYIGHMYEVSYEPGVILVFRVNTETGNQLKIGFWPNDICGNTYAPAIILSASGLYLSYSSTSRLIDTTLTIGGEYDFAFVTEMEGFKVYYKRSDSSVFKMGIRSGDDAYESGRMVFGIESVTIGATPARVKFARIPSQRYIVPPYMSDSFTNPLQSDGLGHAEASQSLGGGGAGVSYSNALPEVSGSDIEIANGDFELWDDVNTPTGWSPFVQGASTVTQETTEVHGGSNSVKFYVPLTANRASIHRGEASLLSKWYITEVWAKSPTTGATIEPSGASNLPLTTDWQKFTAYNLEFSAPGPSVFSGTNTANESTIYIDDIVVSIADFSKMIQVFENDAPSAIHAVITLNGPTAFGGVVLNVDNPASPANCVAFYRRPGQQWRMIKMVSGVWSNVSSVNTTADSLYVRKVGNSFYAYDYQGYAPMTRKDVTDASIISNTYFGRIDPLGDVSSVAFYRDSDNSALNKYVVG